MQNLKMFATNLAMITGSVISWIDSLDSVFRLIVTILTALVGILSAEKLIIERRKRKKGGPK